MRAQGRHTGAAADAAVFSVVKSEKFSMQIVAQIRRRVSDGTLAAGGRLPTERELCASFGASRASIREALSALEILGVIESRGRAKYIRAPAPAGERAEALSQSRVFRGDSAFDLFEARVALEPEIAALAAERATREDLRALASQLAVLESIGRRAGPRADRLEQSVEEYLEADRAFHLLIGRAAHNRVLGRFFSGIHHTLRRSHWKLLRRRVVLDSAGLARLNGEHAAVLEAITQRNARRARALMGRHIHDLQQVLF